MKITKSILILIISASAALAYEDITRVSGYGTTKSDARVAAEEMMSRNYSCSPTRITNVSYVQQGNKFCCILTVAIKR